MRSMRSRVLFLLAAAVFAAALVACQGGEEATPIEVAEVTEPATDVPEQVQESEAATPEEEAEPAPTAEPTPTPVPLVDEDSSCVSCHTDKDKLEELATEPEAVHLSSGEG